MLDSKVISSTSFGSKCFSTLRKFAWVSWPLIVWIFGHFEFWWIIVRSFADLLTFFCVFLQIWKQNLLNYLLVLVINLEIKISTLLALYLNAVLMMLLFKFPFILKYFEQCVDIPDGIIFINPCFELYFFKLLLPNQAVFFLSSNVLVNIIIPYDYILTAIKYDFLYINDLQ